MSNLKYLKLSKLKSNRLYLSSHNFWYIINPRNGNIGMLTPDGYRKISSSDIMMLNMNMRLISMGKVKYDLPLLDCPYCGGEASYHIVDAPFMLKKYRGRYLCAGCKSCKVSTPLFEIQKTGSPILNEFNRIEAMRKAANVWNKRVQVWEVDHE